MKWKNKILFKFFTNNEELAIFQQNKQVKTRYNPLWQALGNILPANAFTLKYDDNKLRFDGKITTHPNLFASYEELDRKEMIPELSKLIPSDVLFFINGLI